MMSIDGFRYVIFDMVMLDWGIRSRQTRTIIWTHGLFTNMG